MQTRLCVILVILWGKFIAQFKKYQFQDQKLSVTIQLTQWERFLINKHDPYFGAIATKMTACDQRVKLVSDGSFRFIRFKYHHKPVNITVTGTSFNQYLNHT